MIIDLCVQTYTSIHRMKIFMRWNIRDKFIIKRNHGKMSHKIFIYQRKILKDSQKKCIVKFTTSHNDFRSYTRWNFNPIKIWHAMKNIIDVILNVIKLATPSSKKLQKENDVSLFDIQYFSSRKYRRHIVFKTFYFLEYCHYIANLTSQKDLNLY